MRFGMIQVDADAMGLALAAHASGRHQVVKVCEPAGFTDVLNGRGIPIVREPWEEVLADSAVEAVIVGGAGNPDKRAAQLRLLVQSDMPALCVHPAGGVLLGFELQMIQKSGGGLVFPFIPGLFHPILASARGIAAQDERPPLGKLVQVEMRRTGTRCDQISVLNAFARDAFVLRLILGRIVRLSALRAGHSDSDDWANLNAQMADDQDRLARWTISPAPVDGLTLTLIGNQGRADVDFTGPPPHWTSTPLLSDDRRSVEDWEGDVSVLDAFETCCRNGDQEGVARDLWEHACRAVELADILELSCRRSRTIELYHEAPSEENTFKGLMAAGGCFALAATLAVIPVVAVLERVSPTLGTSPFWRRLPWVVVLAGLTVFLFTQVFRFAAGSTNTVDGKRGWGAGQRR